MNIDRPIVRMHSIIPQYTHTDNHADSPGSITDLL